MVELGTVSKVCCQREAVFDWKIENFLSSLDKFSEESYYSHDLDFYGCTWFLHLIPDDEVQPTECRIALSLDNGRFPCEFRFSSGIITANGVTEVLETVTITMSRNDTHISDKGIKISKLYRRRDELLPSGVLTLTVSLKVGMEVSPKKDIKNVSVQTEDGVEDKSPKNTGGEKVLQDIVNLWTDDKNCDVVLKVGDVEFRAHRTILAARTPVLCAMFEHNTVEKATGEVTIDDCEPAVFEQLLHFIYTGAPRELIAENASAVYVLADKYLLNELKELCVRCMQDTLCLDTFCKTVKLSLMHGEDELLKIATDFLSRNMILVMKTVEWQRFLHEHTTWGNGILIRAMELIEAKN